MKRKLYNFQSKILIEETIKEFGYDPNKLGNSSSRFVIATCRVCGKHHKIRKGFFIKAGSACHKECKMVEMKMAGSPFADPAVREKSKQTNLKKFGTEYASQNTLIAKNISNTKKTSESQDKSKQTNIERYGVENPFQSEKIKKKIKEKMIEKYGVDHPLKSDEIKENLKQTNIDRYGVEHPLQNEDIQEKVRQTCIERYGVDNPQKDKTIQKKTIKTVQEKYGVNSLLQNKDIYNKVVETHRNRYGFDKPLQNPSIKSIVIEKFKQAVENNHDDNFRLSHVLRNGDFWDDMENGMSLIKLCEKYDIQYNSTRSRLLSEEFYNKYYDLYSFPVQQKQKEIKDIIENLGFKPILNDRSIISPLELDIFIPEENFAIEFNGSYWHSEACLDPKEAQIKHRKKLNLCREKNIRLFNIFEYHWDTRKKQMLNFIKTILNKNDTVIGARECVLTNRDSKQFIDDNHIQKYGNKTIKCFNLEFNNEIVATMTAARHHRQNIQGNPLILNRLCFKEGVNIQGGASKLFKYFMEWARSEGYDRILSWSDNCWTEGEIYKILGFKFMKEYDPDYFYWDMKNRIYTSKQSQMKKNNNCPPEITEHEWCKQHGLYRIYDCGKKLWVYPLKPVTTAV